MKQFIRAEDFYIVEDRIILGGPMLAGGSILSAHVEKRTSLELLGFYTAIGVCAYIVIMSEFSVGLIALCALIFVLIMGARREIIRPYVLVMNIYQIGIFEVRGFTNAEARDVEEAIDELMRETPASHSGTRSSSTTL